MNESQVGLDRPSVNMDGDLMATASSELTDRALMTQWAAHHQRTLSNFYALTDGRSGSNVYRVSLSDGAEHVVKFGANKAEISVAQQLGDTVEYEYSRTPKGQLDPLLPGAIIYDVAPGATLKSIHSQTPFKAPILGEVARAIANFSAEFAQRVQQPLPGRDVVAERFSDPSSTQGAWLRQKIQQGDPIARQVLDICEGVKLASRPIASHNDMHGLNMLMGDDGKISFIDFGTASFMPEGMVVAKLLMNFESEYGSGASKILVSALDLHGFRMDDPNIKRSLAVSLAWRASNNDQDIDHHMYSSIAQKLDQHTPHSPPLMLATDMPADQAEAISWSEFSARARQAVEAAKDKLEWHPVPADPERLFPPSLLWRNHKGVEPFEGQGEDWAHASFGKPQLQVGMDEPMCGIGYRAVASDVTFITGLSSRLGASHPCGNDTSLEHISTAGALSFDNAARPTFGRLADFQREGRPVYEVPASAKICDIECRFALRENPLDGGQPLQAASLDTPDGAEFVKRCEQMDQLARDFASATGIHPLKSKPTTLGTTSRAVRQGRKEGKIDDLLAIVALMNGDELLAGKAGPTAMERARAVLPSKIDASLDQLSSLQLFDPIAFCSWPIETTLKTIDALAGRISVSGAILADWSDKKINALAELCDSFEDLPHLRSIPRLGSACQNIMARQQADFEAEVVANKIRQSIRGLKGQGDFHVVTSYGEQLAPMNSENMAQHIQSRQLGKHDMVRRHGMHELWQAACDSPSLASAMESTGACWREPSILSPIPPIEDLKIYQKIEARREPAAILPSREPKPA